MAPNWRVHAFDFYSSCLAGLARIWYIRFAINTFSDGVTPIKGLISIMMLPAVSIQ